MMFVVVPRIKRLTYQNENTSISLEKHQVFGGMWACVIDNHVSLIYRTHTQYFKKKKNITLTKNTDSYSTLTMQETAH